MDEIHHLSILFLISSVFSLHLPCKIVHFDPPPQIFHSDLRICQTGLISISNGFRDRHLENSMESLVSYPQLMKIKAEVQRYITCAALVHCKTH